MVQYLDALVKSIRATAIKSSFKESVSKLGTLYKSGVYSFDEFTSKKKDLIDTLIARGVTPDKESFLVSLVPLLEEEVLTPKELSLVKDSCNEVKSKLDIDISFSKNSLKLGCIAYIIVATLAVAIYFFLKK